MANEPADLSTFAVAFFEGAHRTVLQAIEGLTDEQLYLQPSPDTNSVGWLAWHMSRWEGQFAARAISEE
ncbi:MAG: DinB family protein, partial [Chloroflexi bacterium]|nr:DinB family protein [Chloroflexota bacterium]